MSNTKETCETYYGWTKDDSVRMNSSSGGFFTELANYVLKQQGIVIGAYFDPATKTVRHGSSDFISIEQMRKSKYVESDMTEVIPTIKAAVSQKRKVMFCGTPCQCAGLRTLFGSTEQIILCDFICHGVPSAKVFQDFLELKEAQHKSGILDYQFRTKDFGWNQHGVKAIYENGETERTVGRCEFYFTATMLRNEFLRESCYTCDKAMYHSSDFTIGDFWGVNQMEMPKDGEKGISAVVVNTEYGKEILQDLMENFELHDLPKHFLEYAFRVKTGDKKIQDRNLKFLEYNKVGIEKYIKNTMQTNCF